MADAPPPPPVVAAPIEAFSPAAPNLRPYQTVRASIADGDLLFWTPTNLFGYLIASGTHGPFSHVGSASWAGDVLESHDMLQFHGGRTANLSALVRQHPGHIHVHRVRNLDAAAFCTRQRRRAGEPYGWWDILGIAGRTAIGGAIRAAWRHRLVDVSKVMEPDLWDRLYIVPADEAAFCSESVVSDLRAAGANALPELAAWEVSPNLLACIADYQFTLI